MMKDLKMIFSEKFSDALSNQEIFEFLYAEYFTRLYRYVYFRLHDKETSMDIVQNVFIKAYEHIEDINLEQALRYLYTVARNQLIDHLRKKHSIILDSFDDFVGNISDNNLDPEDALQLNEEYSSLHTALASLPETARDIIALRYLQELEYSEIAHITGKSELSIRKAVSRSLAMLRDKMKHYEN